MHVDAAYAGAAWSLEDFRKDARLGAGGSGGVFAYWFGLLAFWVMFLCFCLPSLPTCFFPSLPSAWFAFWEIFGLGPYFSRPFGDYF